MAKIKLNPDMDIEEIRKRMPEYIIYQRLGLYCIRNRPPKKETDDTEDIPDIMNPIVTSYKTGKKK